MDKICDPLWENWPLARNMEMEIAVLEGKQPANLNIFSFFCPNQFIDPLAISPHYYKLQND